MNEDAALAKIVAAIFVAPTIIIAQIGSWLLDGWVISKLWGWFFVPLGVPEITIIHAVGISTFVGLIKTHVPRKEDEDKSLAATLGTFLGFFLKPVVAVLIGWIVVQFM